MLSHSASTGKNEFEPVTALTPPHLDKLVELRIAGEQNVLHPSEHHPFWVKRSEGDPGHWIEAANLRVGELLETTEGKWRRIDSVTQLNREETVYNFTVDKDHDYFVGQTGFLVHNARCRCTVFGRKTGKFYKGISGRAGRQANINPILLQLATELFGRIGAEVPGAAPVGSCAEFDAATRSCSRDKRPEGLFMPSIPSVPCSADRWPFLRACGSFTFHAALLFSSVIPTSHSRSQAAILTGSKRMAPDGRRK